MGLIPGQTDQIRMSVESRFNNYVDDVSSFLDMVGGYGKVVMI